MKLWNDSTGLWDLLSLWICENLGALSPSNPCAFEALKSFIPLTPKLLDHVNANPFESPGQHGEPAIPLDP